MRGKGLRLAVTLLTVIPWRGDGDDAAPGGDTAPPRAAAAAAMAWAPAVGLLLGVVASAVLLLADHPLGAGPLTASVLAVGSLALLTRASTSTGWPTWRTAWRAASPHRTRWTSCAARTSERSARSRSS